MQTSDEVYIVHKFIPCCFIYDGERRTMKEQWETAKEFVFIIFFLSFCLSSSRLCTVISHLSSEAWPCFHFLHIRRSSPVPVNQGEVGNNICVSSLQTLRFPNSDEEAAAPDGERLATLLMSAAVVCLFLYPVPLPRVVKTQGSYRNDLVLIITDTAVTEAPQSPDKIHILSVFRHICYIIEWAGRKWKPVIAAEITYWLFSPLSSLFLSSRSSSWCELPGRCSFICYILRRYWFPRSSTSCGPILLVVLRPWRQ